MKITDYLRDSFSFSKMDTFSKCPRKFFYRYIVKRRENTAFQLFGRAVHKGMEIDNMAKLEGRRMPIASVLDAATESYKAECDKEGQPKAIDHFVANHEPQLRAFEEKGIRDQIIPVPKTVEAPFEIEVKIGDPATGKEEIPAKVSGFVDVVSSASPDGPRIVVDYKTGLKPVYQADAESSLQFQLYAIGAKAAGTQVVSFVKQGRQKPTAKITALAKTTPERKERLLTWIADCLRAIRRCLITGDFPKCSPNATWCSKKSCDFFDLCYGPGSAPATLIQIESIKEAGTLEQPDWRK